MIGVLKRVGPTEQGADRMQQSFKESVQKIDTILRSVGIEQELSEQGMSRRMDLIHNLALLKDFELRIRSDAS